MIRFPRSLTLPIAKLPVAVLPAASLPVALLIVVVAGTIHFGTTQLSAAEGNTVSLPQGRNTSGLLVNFAWRHVRVNGLRSVRVEIRPVAGVFVQDREIQIDVNSYKNRRGRGQFSTTKTFVAGEGDRVVEGYMLVPERAVTDYVEVQTYEGGRRLRDLCADYVNTGINSYTEIIPSTLVIDFDAPTNNGRSTPTTSDEKLPDLRPLVLIHSLSREWERRAVNEIEQELADLDKEFSTNDIQQLIRTRPHLEALHPSDLVGEWISLSGIDIAIVSFSDMQRVVTEYPQRWQALNDWVFAGGNLVVYGAGSEFAHLRDIEQSLALRPLSRDAEYLGWERPKGLDRKVAFLSEHYTEDEDDSDAEQMPLLNESAGFVYRGAGLGFIAAFDDEYPFPGEEYTWSTLMNKIDFWSWERRHGMSLIRRNDGFWRFVLAGLGLAPVNLFRVSIVLFVFAIGPVNYFLLKRANRLSWLLITVPAGALIATSGLVVFAVATDGFGVRYRVRSVTHIDQDSGMSATWSRQVYYAGVSPSKGLRFPLDTVVHPLVHSPYLDFESATRRTEWQASQQVLTGGNMQSRVMSQFLVIRSRTTPLRLDIEPIGSGGFNVQNRLGTAIRRVYLVADDGSIHGGSDIAIGASAVLQPEPDVSVARGELKTLVMEHPLQLPEGFTEGSYEDLVRMSSNYYYGSDVTDYAFSPDTSVLQRQIAAAAAVTKLGPRTYVAVVDGCPEVPLGVEGEEQASLYVVTGAW